MTISTVDTSSGPYVGNGIADTFEYDFKIFDKTQLTVLQTDTDGVTTTLAVDSDYTVTNVGEDDGGDIVLSAPLAADYQLFIRANIPVTQETDFESQGGFFPDVHEDAFDKLTLLIQQNAASLARAVRLSGDRPIDGDFVIDEDVDGRRNKVLRFDNDGNVELVEFGSIEGLQNFKVETVAVTAGVTEVTVPFTYLPNTNTIWVNVNGAYVPRSAYSELPGKIVFSNALAAGEVTFFGVSTAPVGTADAANVSYRETSTVEEQLDGALQTVGTLVELQSSEHFVDGQIVETISFLDPGANAPVGGARYNIITRASADADGITYWTSGDYETHYAFALADGDHVAVLSPDQPLSTYQFGYVSGTSNDLQPLVKAFDDFIYTYRKEISHGVNYVAKGNIGSQLILGEPGQVGLGSGVDVNYDLSLTTTYTDVDNYALVIENFKEIKARGNIYVVCGGSSISSRRQRGCVLINNMERGSFTGRITTYGGIRNGVTLTSAPKTTLADIGVLRANFCGLRENVTATNFSQTGSNNSVNQRTTFDISDYEEYVEIGDLVVVTEPDGRKEAHRVQAISGNTVSVYPWLGDITDGQTVTLCTGAGVRTGGGDSSLITIGQIDVFNSGIGYYCGALYPGVVGTVHCNNVGVGITIGRDRNTVAGGSIGTFYVEGGGNIDLAYVETSNVVYGFSVGSVNEMVTIGRITNNSGAKPSRRNKIATKFLSFIDRVYNLDITANNPDGANAADSSKSLTNYSDTTLTYRRDTSTINLVFSEDVMRLTGRGYARAVLLGSGSNNEPTGTITINPPPGWTVNGAASASLSGLTDVVELIVFFNVGSSDAQLFSKTLTLV